MKQVLFILVLTAGCSSTKQVPNYKVANDNIFIYKYSRLNEPHKDILSNGDTLITTKDTLYIIHK